ncbi:hypothetical protein [uncultured Microbacterium sp.]|uniref:hypothetical protein n=1 Tax=uncultured Microbacterium sp. TaxID=191216 RepID=UPI0025FCBEDF|nr:hypothetical protein [uncultured Microbacterium sp.]
MPNIALELGKQTATLGVHSAYGEPVVIDGVTVIPVAATWQGFGGGADESGNGGGGGGGYSLPIGAYVREGDTIRFEPNVIALLTVIVPVLWVGGRALARIIRALKR